DSPASTTCGSTWIARPGGSSDPPAAIPGQISVIVTDKVTKQGSTNGGRVVHIVIVRVNAGYGLDPGQAGTGKVIGPVCLGDGLRVGRGLSRSRASGSGAFRREQRRCLRPSF